MKKIILFILVAVSMISCSPQLRLNRLLKHHPELIQQQDKHVIHDTIIIPEIKESVIVPVQDITDMLSSQVSYGDNTEVRTGISIEAGNAELSVTPYDDTRLRFDLTQHLDTIIIRDTVSVPHVLVTKVPKKLNWFQKSLITSGVFLWIAILLCIIYLLIKRKNIKII